MPLESLPFMLRMTEDEAFALGRTIAFFSRREIIQREHLRECIEIPHRSGLQNSLVGKPGHKVRLNV